jgi:xylulokinase
MDYVIGCDLGSQGVKVILLTAEGGLAGGASAGYGIDYPHPTWADQPASRWTEGLRSAVRQLLRETGIAPSQVRAIGLDAQVDGVVPVDGAGNVLRPAIIWMDRRAVEQCKAVEGVRRKEDIFQITGLNLDPSHVAPKIRWLADREPTVYHITRYMLLPGSYAAYYLTGELGVDASNASSTMLMDVRTKTWSREMCEAFGIETEKLAPILTSLTDMGRLRAEVAEEVGLTTATRVILGSGDEHAASLGAGAIRPGIICDIAGTAEPVCVASSTPVFDPTGLVETHCHADPDLWLIENPGFASGANYRWFRDEFSALEMKEAAESGGNAYERLNALAAEAPPGSDGLIFLPCLMGALAPTWNAAARGTYFGFSLSHTRKHFVRALLEGSAYAVRDITDQMRKIRLEPQEVRVVGGGAQSRLWRQIKADVTGLPIALPQTTETTALGAGMLALVGAGLCGSLAEAAEQVVKIVDVIDPNPEAQRIYEEHYQLYQETYRALLPVFDRLAGLQAR